MIGRYVVVRTINAGVHVGVLVEQNGMQVKLRESRRVWYWEGAFTLNEISVIGITGGKISVTVPEIMLTEVIEIIPCSKQSSTILREIAAYVPR